MIPLLRVGLLAVPLTLWYSTRIRWASLRRSPDLLRLCDELPRRWARRLLAVARVEVQSIGARVIDPAVPQILVSNHASWFDVLALAAVLPGRFRFVGKRELEHVPFFGPGFRAAGNILVDREDRNRARESMEQARRRLEEERPTIIMFPEGTRSEDGELHPFKKGAFILAIQSGAAVVPVRIEGSRKVMAKGSWRIRPGRILVRFGEVIPVRGLTMEDRDALMRTAWDAVAALKPVPQRR